MKNILSSLLIFFSVSSCHAEDRYETIYHGCGKNKISEKVKKYYVPYDKIILEEDQMLVPIENELFSIKNLNKDDQGFYVLKKDIDVTVQLKEHRDYYCRDCNKNFKNENGFYKHKIGNECSAKIRKEREKRKEDQERRERCRKRSEFRIPDHHIPQHSIPNHNISVPR